MVGSGFSLHNMVGKAAAACLVALLVFMDGHQFATACRCGSGESTSSLCDLIGDADKILLNVQMIRCGQPAEDDDACLYYQ